MIFLINIPIGIAGILLATRFLPDTPPAPTPKLDVPGLILSSIAASGIVFGLSVVSLPALPPTVGISTLVVGIIAAALYLLHARRAASPLLALNLFSNQTFRAAVVGGSIFRIGIGAVPFLLPLMLQIGFGFSPFQSGLITFVTALGALGMKFATTWVFRSFGFRRVLIAGSLVTASTIAVYGLFTPATPVWVMMLLILVGGFIRSMFFTGVNAFAYADIATEDASRATPIVAVAQQLSIALGVALAGGILEVSTILRGGPLLIGDFHLAFFIVAAISACAAVAFIRLAPDAGSRLRPRPAAAGHREGMTAQENSRSYCGSCC